MKTCFKCGTLKPLDEFYPHPNMADGHLNKCKECTKKDAAERAHQKSSDPTWVLSERKRNRIRAAGLRAAGRFPRPSPGVKRRYIEEHVSRHPEKHAARRAATNAIYAGLLIKQPCEKCGDPEVEAHHDDYSKPLVVRWLCTTHHAEHHVAERERELLSKLITA